MAKKSCINCTHYAVCGVRPDPYLGAHSSAHLGDKFDDLKTLIIEFYGKNCDEYTGDGGE